MRKINAHISFTNLRRKSTICCEFLWCIRDIYAAPLHVAEVFDSPDDTYWFQETLIKQIIDDNAPIKTKTIKGNQVPYMNGKLRRER